jgi:FtsP/CotA-like multicopper oxidase with cupredoxin domain
MKYRLTLALAVAATACAALVAGAAADRGHGRGQLFTFRGELLAAPGPNATTLSVQVETGNKPALRALIGASQNQVFAVDSGTEILIWSHGVPHVGSTADLQSGDFVTVRIRAAGDSSLQEIEKQPAAIVADTAVPNGRGPLWLFSGTVAGPQSGGTLALHVGSGNWKALQAMLGQPLDQTFTYDDGTIFLLWQGRVPTVIDPSQLKAGDRITVRIRAPRSDSLAQVEATPAAHVGDHEPAPNPAD